MAVSSFNEGAVSVRLCDGRDGRSAAASFGTESNPYDLAVGDFDGDGRFDLTVAFFSGAVKCATVLWGDGAGRFAVARSYGIPEWEVWAVTAADFHGDGRIDLAVVPRGWAGCRCWWWGGRRGNFGAAGEAGGVQFE